MPDISKYVSQILIAVLIVLIIVITLLIITMVQNKKLNKKYNQFMQGSKAKSLEAQIASIIIENKELVELSHKNKKEISDLRRKQEKSFQKMGINKYDAFSEMGGKISFTLALLDNNNDGMIINSIYGREGCYTYMKEIENGTSEAVMGEEEQKALDKALDNK